MHGIYTSIQSCGTKCHIIRQVWIQRMSNTHSILARVQYYLLDVTEGLNYKAKKYAILHTNQNTTACGRKSEAF